MRTLIATLGIVGGLLAFGGTASAQYGPPRHGHYGPGHHHHRPPVVVYPAPPVYRPVVVAPPVYAPPVVVAPAPVYRPIYPTYVYPGTSFNFGIARPGFSFGFSTFR